MFRTFLLVGLGGAVGSMMRYAVSLLLPKAHAITFPAATLVVNLLGCLAIGILAGVAARSQWMAHTGWALLATGVCGGFTTFSAFALESLKLMEGGAAWTAVIYMAISLAAGTVLCYGGYYLASSSA